MAASIFIEQESGTSRGWVHPHNGYYAGDFTRPPKTRRAHARSNPALERPRRTDRHASSQMGGV
jgi:hypothetical protein